MRRLALISLLMLVAGCIVSSGGDDATTPTPTPTPTATPTPTPAALRVELAWPTEFTQVDLDVHLVNKQAGGAMWDASLDCYSATCVPAMAPLDWGDFGAPGNPSLAADNQTDSFPEEISIQTANPGGGVYGVCVWYYAAVSMPEPAAEADVKVYVNGTLTYQASNTLSGPQQSWYVGDITWSGGSATVTSVGSIGMSANHNDIGTTCGF